MINNLDSFMWETINIGRTFLKIIWGKDGNQHTKKTMAQSDNKYFWGETGIQSQSFKFVKIMLQNIYELIQQINTKNYLKQYSYRHRTMGNQCKCQNFGQAEFSAPHLTPTKITNSQQFRPRRIQPQSNFQPPKSPNSQSQTLSHTQSNPQSQLPIPKPPSHQPSPTFAVAIQKFPALSQKIIEIDTKLGVFLPQNQQYFLKTGQNPSTFPSVLIKKPYKLSNGIIYQGEWLNGKIHGNGVYLLPDGSFIRGFSIGNQIIGHIRYINQNGNYYEGFSKNNQANGQGVLCENGVVYRGVFVDNFLEGKGEEEAREGRGDGKGGYHFEGDYERGAKKYGKLMWDWKNGVPGSVYEGGFFDEHFSGEGKLVNQIGEYQGGFENGKKKGKGVFRWKNGQRFQGYYDNDLKNGQGKMFNAKQQIVLQGAWENDKFKY